MSYSPPPFEVADKLASEIISFLLECGGVYDQEYPRVYENLFFAIATGQFFYKRNCYFVCYWRVQPNDVENVKNRVEINNKTHGPIMYVVECGMEGRYMKEMISRLRKKAKGMKGVFWHRPAKNDAVFDYPSQKGENYGIKRV